MRSLAHGTNVIFPVIFSYFFFTVMKRLLTPLYLIRYKLAKDHIIEVIKERSFKTSDKTLSEEAMKILPILVLIYNVFQNLRHDVVKVLKGEFNFS